MKTKTPAIADEIKSYLNKIAERLWTGHAAVMIGAGFSRNAKTESTPQKSFPDWNQLGDAFYEKIHRKLPGNNNRYLNVLKLADEVQAAFGRPTLNQILRSSIPDEEYEPSQLHTKLLELPWTDVFTTNYDTLLERACVNVESQKFDIVIYSTALHTTFYQSKGYVLSGTVLTNWFYRLIILNCVFNDSLNA